MSGVFISYRRSDANEAFDRFRVRLEFLLKHTSIFIDKERIEIGESFPGRIASALVDSDIILAVIGSNWNNEQTRLQDPEDWVRTELLLSFQSEKIVIPIIIGNGRPPTISELPDIIKRLAYLNAAILTSNLSLEDYDLRFNRLLERLRSILIHKDSVFAITQEAIDAIQSGKVKRYWEDKSRDQYEMHLASLTNSIGGGWKVEKLANNGDGLSNDQINIELVVNQPIIWLETKPQPWHAYSSKDDPLRKYVIATNYSAGGEMYVDEKIRLITDFYGGLPNIATIQKTDYLSSMMTDQWRWRRVVSESFNAGTGRHDEVLWAGTQNFLSWSDGKSCLRSLEHSKTSNQLGASTFAFTSDGYLLIVKQNGLNRESPNTLAPSGSGSLDWSDYERQRFQDLLSLVSYGAERELREECSLEFHDDSHKIIQSRVLPFAFTRMIHRAGKPEFYCLGYVDATAAEVCERPREKYVGAVIIADVDRANWTAARPSEQITRICREYLNKIEPRIEKTGGDRQGQRESDVQSSAPLHHGLLLLQRVCASEAAAVIIDEFISGNGW